jgi:hypothetical protein
MFGAQLYSAPNTSDAVGNVWTVNQHSLVHDARVLGVNLDIIERENLPNPVDLHHAGLWTWDAMLDIMRAATRETPAGPQFGIAGQPGDIVKFLIGSNDGVMVDENFNYGFAHPNTVAALEFAEVIFGERLWASENGVMDAGNWDRNFYSGKRDGNAVLFSTVIWGLDNAPPNFDFAVVPFPTGPNNTTGNTWMRGMEQGIAIPVGVQDWTVEEIVIILDELFSWPGHHYRLLFTTGELAWMRDTFNTEACVQRTIRAGVNAATDIGMDVREYYWVLGMFAQHFHDGTHDVMQAIEYQRDPHQEMLDRRFR